MRTSPIVLAVAFAWATGVMTMSSALGQADDLNARKAQDRDQDDRIQTYKRGQEDLRDEHASPQILQAPNRRMPFGYEDPGRGPQPADAPLSVFRYPSDKPGLTLQSPRTRPFVPLD